MKKLILFAGAATLAFAGAAANAKPPHAGQGRGHGAAMSQQGRDIARGAIGERGFGSHYGYGLGGCPPGLMKKGCVPPGQAKRFGVGQRVPAGYQGLLGYGALPYDVRSHYGPQLDPYSRYIYDNSYVYRVDPRTMIVQQILSAVLRPY